MLDSLKTGQTGQANHEGVSNRSAISLFLLYIKRRRQAIYGNPWQGNAISGSQRQEKAISGKAWQSLATDRGNSGRIKTGMASPDFVDFVPNFSVLPASISTT